MHGTSVRTVAARRAGDHVLGAQDGTHLGNRRTFCLVQRLEIRHVGQVILHLLQIAHAGKHHEDTVKSGGKTDGIAGRTGHLPAD